MKYKKFIINEYKAISGNLELDISKSSLIPIIGINEGGKTSILQAVFAFDSHNDNLNRKKHIEQPENFYKVDNQPIPSVSAEIEITKQDLKDAIKSVEEDIDSKLTNLNNTKLNLDKSRAEVAFSNTINQVLAPNLEEKKVDENKYSSIIKQISELEQTKNRISSFKRGCTSCNDVVLVTRNLKTLEYEIENEVFKKYPELNNLIATELIRYCPYILYFDDFRDSIPREIEINHDSPSNLLNFFEQAFKKTSTNYSVYGLRDKEYRQKKSLLSDVSKKINSSLKVWEAFTLDKSSTLEIILDHYIDSKSNKEFLRIDIVETINNIERYFSIEDRSKGFYWFFNFVMKLVFNPKVRDLNDTDTIYLLDEPCSYLHPSAQHKLCEMLFKLSEKNKVIYCTHSHYLLNPEVIPINKIVIAKKDSSKNVVLLPINDYTDENKPMRDALEPIRDALEVRPFIIDMTTKNVCITEGINDFFVLDMFKPERLDISFIPSKNAHCISYHISLAIGWGLNYIAIWDKDEEGIKYYSDAIKYFGQSEAEKFLLLPSKLSNKRKFIIQDVFEGEDIKLIKQQLELPTNTNFKKVISTLYYSPIKAKIIDKISAKTKESINYIHRTIAQKLKLELLNTVERVVEALKV